MQLVEFLASPEGQQIYADINNEYPVAPGASASELVSSWGDFEADSTSLSTIADLRPQALKIVEEVNFDE